MEQKIFVGVDLHKDQFTICILKDGKVLEEGTKYELNKDGYRNFIAMIKELSYSTGYEEVVLAIESTTNSRYFKDIMVRQGFRVEVVNTLRFKVVNQSTKKTDKNDARTLAEFLSRDILPTSHLCSAETEGLRRVLKTRNLMVRDVVALKNQAHAVLSAYGIITKTAEFQSRKERESVLARLPVKAALPVGIIFGTIDAVEKQKKVLESRLRVITEKDHTVGLLMTIPGVGIVNACTIRAYIDDIDRFETYKNFSAYCGLVPWVQSSNETAYYGRITKRGPQELRTALVQCVVAMVRMENKTGDFGIIRQYHELKDSKNSGKAIIATARKLSRIIYMMLKTDSTFNSARAIGHSALPEGA